MRDYASMTKQLTWARRYQVCTDCALEKQCEGMCVFGKAADAIEELLAAVPANRVDYKWLNASNSVIATMTIEKFECGWISLSNFKIAEAYRGQGLSHKLIEFAKTKGVNNLSVDPNNSIAINLYQQHGFFLTGETDGNFYRMRLTKPTKEVE